MKNNSRSSRRNFLRNIAGSTAAMAVGNNVLAASDQKDYVDYLDRLYTDGPNDKINFALIGAGGMGTQDTITALKIPGAKLVAVCDLYDGRLNDAKKAWGNDIYTTKH